MDYYLCLPICLISILVCLNYKKGYILKKHYPLFITSLIFLFASCQSTKAVSDLEKQQSNAPSIDNTITLLFAGDVMAHNVNYNMKDYDIIWDGVRDTVQECDLAFANIEAPIDTTKPASNYPYFNMPKAYVQATIDAGFNVFSLCNNHTNDQELSGIKETIKTVNSLKTSEKEKGNEIYFAGVKEHSADSFIFQLIEKNGWKILFLPMTEILNRPLANQYINYINSSSKKRQEFADFCKKLRDENPCDLFILSWHANEPEYTRVVTEAQEAFYQSLLEAGVDIIWANHAHIIKDRKITINEETGSTKIIMYANGNTISGQRTKPDFKSENPIGERDNTGDGLFYKVTFGKKKNSDQITFVKSENIFITTYITPERNYIIHKMDDNFINYLDDNGFSNWARYIEKRITINNTYTKEIIEWQ